jgi:hypothetical protein
VPSPSGPPPDELLLDAVRRGLAPGDPVARLLAAWPAPPARAIATHVVRRGPARLAEPV